MNAPPGAAAEAPGGRLFLRVIPSIMLPMFLASVDATIVAAALPAIAADMGEVERVSWVVVAFLVNEKGEVERFRIVEADPPLIFDSAVNAAVPSFRFAPAMRNGKPSSYETRLTLSFKPQGRDGPK